MISVRRVAAPPIGPALREIAAAVERLSPSRRDPERFFAERDDLADRLREAAREIERRSAPAIPRPRA